MVAVGLDEQRVGAPADAHEVPADGEVDRRRREGQPDAEVDAVQFAAGGEPRRREGDGADPREDDEYALDAAREELDLLVAEGVRGVGGAGGVAQRHVGGDRGDEVDARLERVRE